MAKIYDLIATLPKAIGVYYFVVILINMNYVWDYSVSDLTLVVLGSDLKQ